MRDDLIVEREEYERGIVGTIYYDRDPLNPRKDYDNVATMVCWHGRYDLGDEQPKGDPIDYFRGLVDDECPHCEGTGDDLEGERGDYNLLPDCEHCGGTGVISDEDVMELFEKDHYLLPLYLYDHSGITMSTGSFGCPWDSGQVGWIFVSYERAHAEWGTHKMELVQEGFRGAKGNWQPAQYKQGAPLTYLDYYEFMRGEVETYDHYLTGECYGYVIEDENGEYLDSCWGYLGDIKWVWEAMEMAAKYCVKSAEKEEREVQCWAERDVITA